MSLPVATYKCTACNYSRWDSFIWGYRYYLIGETEVPMRVTVGWCQPCNDLVAIEVLPTADGEADIQQLLVALQVKLCEELTASPPTKRWWQRYARASTQQTSLVNEIKSTEERLAKYRLRRTALLTRTSQARCLRCSSEDCVPLPPHEAEYYGMNSAPAPTGFTHPGCGGELITVCDGTRLSLRLTEKAYDLEGRLASPGIAEGLASD